MRVAAIMPIYNTCVEWQQDAINALANQYGLGDAFDLEVIRVFREDSPGEHPRVDSHLPVTDISFQFDEDRPTPIEQCAVGMKCAEEKAVDYMFCLSSNDVYELDYVGLCLQTEKPVAYGDIGLCDDGMIHNRMVGTPHKYDPAMIALRTRNLSNQLPDSALISMDVYREIGFSTLFHRNSFHAFWIKIWEKYGSDHFSHIGKPGFWMRGHDYHDSLPGRDQYMKDGSERVAVFLFSRKWVEEINMKGGL